MRARLIGSFLGVCLALTGCNNTTAATDTGTSPGNDAGNDAASTPGSDAGSDTGSTDDAGSATDANTDAAATPDTNVVGCAMNFAGCTTFEDHTADTMVTVNFAATGFAYTPNCIRIHTGTMVALPGATIHPLANAMCSPADSPIPTASTTGGTFTFTSAGNYGFHCAVHGSDLGTGMSGLIVVE